jgi:hypothetical protein
MNTILIDDYPVIFWNETRVLNYLNSQFPFKIFAMQDNVDYSADGSYTVSSINYKIKVESHEMSIESIHDNVKELVYYLRNIDDQEITALYLGYWDFGTIRFVAEF